MRDLRPGKTNPFRSILRGRVLIFGMGNVLRGDDGAGPALCELLRQLPGLVCVNAGSAPENYLGVAAREDPDTLLLADALHLGLAPGEAALLQPAELDGRGFGGHDLPLKLLCALLARETGAEIVILGIQPQTLALGSPLSPAVAGALSRLERLIAEALSGAPDPRRGNK